MSSVWPWFLMACVVTYAHALLLGIPIACVLGRRNALTLPRVVFAAFLVGAMPFGAFTLYQEATMPPGAGYSANGIVIREAGRLTSAGWRQAVLSILQLGALGAAAGLVWWAIARPRSRSG